uniref:Uncharacterized protein n=1 Tax=Rhodnius prolixus TaxID=13249 RepID=T1IFS4_RHOPR
MSMLTLLQSVKLLMLRYMATPPARRPTVRLPEEWFGEGSVM